MIEFETHENVHFLLPCVPLTEIILWSQFKRRKPLYAFSKKHITKADFVHPLVGLGRLLGLLFVQLPHGPVRKTMSRSSEELWARFHKGFLSMFSLSLQPGSASRKCKEQISLQEHHWIMGWKALWAWCLCCHWYWIQGLVSGSCLRVYERWKKASSRFGNSQAWVQKGPLPPENWSHFPSLCDKPYWD